MELILFLIGILSIISGIAFGMLSDNFLFFTISGIMSSVIFFGLAKILSNQDKILIALDSNARSLGNVTRNEEVECKSCGKMYEYDRKSCPFCGERISNL